MCRQFIREFADLDTPIFMYDKDGDYVVKTLEQVWKKKILESWQFSLIDSPICWV